VFTGSRSPLALTLIVANTAIASTAEKGNFERAERIEHPLLQPERLCLFLSHSYLIFNLAARASLRYSSCIAIRTAAPHSSPVALGCVRIGLLHLIGPGSD